MSLFKSYKFNTDIDQSCAFSYVAVAVLKLPKLLITDGSNFMKDGRIEVTSLL